MLWNKILLVYDGSESALRATEYIAKMFGKTEGLQVTIFGLHERVPRHDFKDTSPVVDKLARHLTAMEREIERGQARIKEAKALLAKAGPPESSISIKYSEMKKSAVKDILAEAKNGGYGTIVVGRSEAGGFILAGGNVAKDLAAQAKGFGVIVV
ncbi:MAG: universal stress protein [Thermodesulfobacteriota bacterium]